MQNNLVCREAAISTGKPYTQVEESDYFVREFSESVDPMELVWHRDREDREVTILEGSGWKLQMDNEQPRELIQGKTYRIPAMEYHRIIKGKDNLLLQIKEKVK